MSNDQEDAKKERPNDSSPVDKTTGYKGYLDNLKDNKNSKISGFIGTAKEIYAEINKLSQPANSAVSESVVAPDAAVKEGVLIKAVELARVEWVKSKLDSDDPVELSHSYNSRLARLNDEYHHKNILFADVMVIGFMKDKDTGADRLLISKDKPESRDQVFAIDPKTGVVLEVFEVSSRNSLVTLLRSG
jgi:hypothetical protein